MTYFTSLQPLKCLHTLQKQVLNRSLLNLVKNKQKKTKIVLLLCPVMFLTNVCFLKHCFSLSLILGGGGDQPLIVKDDKLNLVKKIFFFLMIGHEISFIIQRQGLLNLVTFCFISVFSLQKLKQFSNSSKECTIFKTMQSLLEKSDITLQLYHTVNITEHSF